MNLKVQGRFRQAQACPAFAGQQALSKQEDFPKNVRIVEGTVKETGSQALPGPNEKHENLVKYAYILIETDKDIFKVQHLCRERRFDALLMMSIRKRL